eukprot:gene20285-33046_t
MRAAARRRVVCARRAGTRHAAPRRGVTRTDAAQARSGGGVPSRLALGARSLDIAAGPEAGQAGVMQAGAGSHGAIMPSDPPLQTLRDVPGIAGGGMGWCSSQAEQRIAPDGRALTLVEFFAQGFVATAGCTMLRMEGQRGHHNLWSSAGTAEPHDGHTLLMLHGAPGSRRDFRYLASCTEDFARTVRLADDAEPSAAAMAAAAGEAAARLHSSPGGVVAVGHSVGCHAALELAAARPPELCTAALPEVGDVRDVVFPPDAAGYKGVVVRRSGHNGSDRPPTTELRWSRKGAEGDHP